MKEAREEVEGWRKEERRRGVMREEGREWEGSGRVREGEGRV